MLDSNAARFRRCLVEGPLTSDGALGTLLLASASPQAACLEALNLERPDVVLDIHRRYRDAGAEILQTNTFGANRFRLAATGMEKNVASINAAGVELARQAAGSGVFVAGAVGPSGLIRPGASPNITAGEEENLFQAFREQIGALIAGGVDLIVLETFYARGELLVALRAARAVSANVPVVAQVAVNERGDLPDGSRWPQFCVELEQGGAEVIGCNCSRGPGDVLLALRQLAKHSGLPLSAQPSAGLPSEQGCYPCDPESFAAAMGALLEAGASIVGGCCGSTPAHIERARAVVDEYRREPAVRAAAPLSRSTAIHP